MKMPSVFPTTIKLLLLAGCFGYVLYEVDLQRLLGQVQSLSASGIGVFIVLMLGSYVLHGYRIRTLANGNISLLSALKCFCFGQGVNYTMPSKLGEMGKVLYLNKVSRIAASAATEVVFWERFFDINCLVGLVLLSLSRVAGSMTVISLSLVWGALWVLLLFIRISKLSLLEKMCNIMPVTPARAFLFDLVRLIRKNFTVPFFARQALLSTVAWTLNCLHVYLFYQLAGGVSLSWLDFLYVFVISSVGYAVPAAPGGIGLYEAAIVYGLVSSGVPKELALSLALVQHMLLFIIALCGLGYVLATTKLRMSDLLPKRAKPEAAAGREGRH